MNNFGRDVGNQISGSIALGAILWIVLIVTMCSNL